jgi:hypothetical protein
MAHRVNVMLDGEALEGLRGILRGERSRFVSDAVRYATLRQRRRTAAAQLTAISRSLCKAAGTAEERIRADRDAG